MDVLNIALCLQVCFACGNRSPALLYDTAACRLDRKRCILCIVLNIAVKVDIPSRCIGIGYIDASVFLSKEPKCNRIIRLQRECIRLGRTCFGCPCRMVFGVRPKRPPVAAFLPATGNRTRGAGYLAFQNSAKFRIYELFTIVCISIANRINKCTGTQLTSILLLNFRWFCSYFLL